MSKPENEQQPVHTQEPPAGFTQADTDVDNFDAWDFEKFGKLEGTVLKVKTVGLIRRGEDVDVRMAVVEHPTGEKYCLWESANLGDFFDNIDKGMEILVEQSGSQTLSGARHMKLYRAYYRQP